MRPFASLLLAFACLIVMSGSSSAQTTSDFENLSLPVDSFYNGSDYAGSFTSGNAVFPNLYLYDSTYGGYWASGFAYSSMRDSVDGTFLNMYSARPATGAEGSATYAIGQQGSVLKLTGAAAGKAVMGAYFTNGSYGTYSMENGDGFAKKFGGATGDDPDWFKVTVKAWFNGTLGNDSVDIYLADYRFSNNDQDYILRDWQWFSLLSLGNADSLRFTLSSSDNGAYGMNTPPFFYFDQFKTADSPYGIKENSLVSMKLSPNPAVDYLCIDLGENSGLALLEVLDLSGRVLQQQSIENSRERIDLRNLESGCYLLRASGRQQQLIQPFIINAR